MPILPDGTTNPRQIATREDIAMLAPAVHTHTASQITVTADRILGRVSAENGAGEELTQAQVRTFLGLGDAAYTAASNYEPAIGTKRTAFNKSYGTTTTDVKMNGTQAVGSVDAIARIDHVHPVDTSRQATITGGASTITSSNLTASMALVSDANGKVAASSISNTKIVYLTDVTSNIQSQLNGKANLTGANFTGNVTASAGLNIGTTIPSKGDGSTVYYGTDTKTLNQAAGASGFYVNSAKQNRFYCLTQNDKYECFSNYRGNGLDTPSSLPSGLWYASNSTITSTGQSWELGNLFDNIFTSAATFPVANLAAKPLVITIVTTGSTQIDYTDTNYLVLNGWRYGGVQTAYPHLGKLNSYSVEICTDKVNDTWVKVFERTGVSDSIDALYIPLWSSLGGAAGYMSFYGVRLTVTEATQGGVAGIFGITEIKLMENRPAGLPSDSVGALSLAGGTVYGDIILGSKFNQSIRPSINKTKSIGTSAYQFKDIYGEVLYENNQRVYSPNNKPSWTDIASKPSWIGASRPTYTASDVGLGTTSTPTFARQILSQGMTNGNTSAFTAPHLSLIATDMVDNTGFVGMTFATASSANYGWSYGAQRTIGGNGDLIWRNHDGTTTGTERMRLSDAGVLTATTFIGDLTGNAETATNASAVTTTAENTGTTSRYILFANSVSGNQALKTDTGLTYHPTANALTVGSAAVN